MTSLSSLKVLAIHLFMGNFKKKILNDRKLVHISEDVWQTLKKTIIFEEAKEACEKESLDSKVFYTPPPHTHTKSYTF